MTELQSVERQGSVLSAQTTEGRVLAAQSDEPTSFRLAERMRELEAENSRLKSLVGELLMANQLLRERREAGHL